jgi:hypothetical protein
MPDNPSPLSLEHAVALYEDEYLQPGTALCLKWQGGDVLMVFRGGQAAEGSLRAHAE